MMSRGSLPARSRLSFPISSPLFGESGNLSIEIRLGLFQEPAVIRIHRVTPALPQSLRLGRYPRWECIDKHVLRPYPKFCCFHQFARYAATPGSNASCHLKDRTLSD